MLKLENIPPEQMPEVVRIASELQQQDLQQAEEEQERQSTIAAAEEVGLPEKYLHQAAAELHARRVAQLLARQQRNARLAGIIFILLPVLLAGWLLLRLSAPTHVAPPVVAPPPIHVQDNTTLSPPFGASQWMINANKGTQATVAFENGTAVVKVQRFVPDTAGRYTANLDTKTGPMSLGGYQTVSFRAHGTLPHVRLYLESTGERWRSPALAVSGQDKTYNVDLKDFEHQVRDQSSTGWRKTSYQAPTTVEGFSFKTGWYVNDVNATGEVALSDLSFK